MYLELILILWVHLVQLILEKNAYRGLNPLTQVQQVHILDLIEDIVLLFYGCQVLQNQAPRPGNIAILKMVSILKTSFSNH